MTAFYDLGEIPVKMGDDVDHMLSQQAQPGWSAQHPDVQKLMDFLAQRDARVDVPQGVRGRRASANPTPPDEVDMMMSEQAQPGWNAQHPDAAALLNMLLAPRAP